ncbi:DUF1275 domain-containing protein [Pigmentiphaga aceris]|uniref:DUF1275 domain-containing protein n=1 Tax=Pigmentiphaga aceris TaxID=1940612 RepID=A0A5C0AWF2_9BURK|nr:YoaK family protein [Pigmentiphaga aceris]QEI06076.1 DUF1275 domain-containing protein [Pigmentiphaga aceris]
MLSRFSHWADSRRIAHDDARLGVCLAFVAGAANAGGFLAVGQYTSHMTGMVSGMADHLILSNTRLALAGLAAVSAFTAGAMVTAILVNFARRQRLHARFSIPLLVEAGLLLMFGLMGAQLAAHTGLLLPLTVLLLCFLMGLQNAVITKVSRAVIRTTHTTGLITDIGIELGKLVYVNRHQRGATEPVLANRKKLQLHSMLLAAFFSGGLIGAAGFQWIGYAATIPLAVLLLLIAMPPLGRDVRARLRLRRRIAAK